MAAIREYVETRLLRSFHKWIATFNFCLQSNWRRVIISEVHRRTWPLRVYESFVPAENWNKSFSASRWIINFHDSFISTSFPLRTEEKGEFISWFHYKYIWYWLFADRKSSNVSDGRHDEWKILSNKCFPKWCFSLSSLRLSRLRP